MPADELRAAVGRTFGPTAWRTVTQEEVDAFAALAGDEQWIHVDVERARRESPFGTTIVHGTLTLAMIDGWRDELVGASAGARLGVNLGYDRVRFPTHVPVGARVRARMEVVAAEQRPDGWWQVVQRFTVEVENGARPACVADSIVRVLV